MNPQHRARSVALALVTVLALAGALAVASRGENVRAGGAFDLFAFFEGDSVSRGTIRTGLVFTEDFTARFVGSRNASGFRLEERFSFADGQRLQVWTLAQESTGALSGTVETEQADGTLAPPVPVSGASGPDGVTLDYRGIAPGGGRLRLHFRHAMRANGDGTVENRVRVSKFGLPLAISRVIFAKREAALPSPTGER